jgi:hypothetical protein
VPREKQIEFPPEQTHHRLVAPVCWLIAIACIVAVIILVYTVDGAFIGPW